jgi:hypothetical protein
MNLLLILQLLALHRRLRRRDSWACEQSAAPQARSLELKIDAKLARPMQKGAHRWSMTRTP